MDVVDICIERYCEAWEEGWSPLQVRCGFLTPLVSYSIRSTHRVLPPFCSLLCLPVCADLYYLTFSRVCTPLKIIQQS